MGKMIDLKRSPEDLKKEMAEEKSVMSTRPKYPYGLKIYLDHDTMEKLNLSGDLQVGESFPITAQVEVTSFEKSSRVEEPKVKLSASLQITAIEMPGEEKSNTDKAAILFNKAESK